MDSSLLLDCVRVLSRLLNHVRKIDPGVAGRRRARVRNAKRLAQQIAGGPAQRAGSCAARQEASERTSNVADEYFIFTAAMRVKSPLTLLGPRR